MLLMLALDAIEDDPALRERLRRLLGVADASCRRAPRPTTLLRGISGPEAPA
jgi:hypothetical protein